MEKLDSKLATWISKKLMVWILATIALFLGKIDGQEWMFISLMYIFAQGVIDAKILFEYFKNK